jgi:uncharacterized protein YehS (DUF1456 family)
MTHNDVLRSVRYLMNISDAALADIIRLDLRDPQDLQGLQGLDDGKVSKADVAAFLKKDDEEGYRVCSDQVMAHFLNGLVTYKRGKDENRSPQPVEVPVTNNVVLKKLRAAFELKDSDIVTLLEKVGLRVSKTELGAFFRRPDHRNYRDCGDQFLRNFLKGLASLPLLAAPFPQSGARR